MAINTGPDVHELVICANIFIRKDDKYLVLRRSEQKRYAPGVELDEDPFAAAVREVREETGLTVRNVRLEAVINEIAPPPDREQNWVIFHFSADYAAGEVTGTDEGELQWQTAEEIQAAKLFPSLGMVIDQVLDPAVGTVFVTCGYNDRDEIEREQAAINQCAR
jgi:8-oxo-dGTP diphosphatase